MYIALFACVPFKGDNISSLNNSILNDEVTFPSHSLPKNVELAIKGMLQKDPRHRISLLELECLLKLKQEGK